jgi:fermentation-respiration switch protein FrsA (DUF1100 family)
MDRQKLKRLIVGNLTLKKFVRSVLLALLGFYLALLLYAVLFTEKTIFHPPSASYRDSAQILKLPSGNGITIAALYLPNPAARYTILYSHGNGEDLGQLRSMLTKVKEMGFAVLAYDYRGYGTSGGTPSETNAYEDEEAAYHYLVNDRHIPAHHIIALGHSLGGAMAVDLASRRSLGGLIMESAFVSADRIVTHIPILPFDKFQNVAKIRQVRCPVLILHGKQDTTLPLWHGETLFAAANAPKRAVWIEGAGHNDIFETAGPRYAQTLHDFVALIEQQPER